MLYTPRFRRSFKKLPDELQKLAWQKIEMFRDAPFHPTLRTHKLTVGDLWAFWVDYKNRVTLQFLGEGRALLVNVGDHSIYRRLKR